MTITGKTRVLGVWGCPVAHSRSPQMHNAAFRALDLDWVYVPFSVDPADVATAVAAVRTLHMVGVNVTVPLKELVGPHLDTLSATARRIGAVNTIINHDGFLHGDSTDGEGLLRALAAAGQNPLGKRVLLLGAGGSARAAAFALSGVGSRIVISARSEEKSHRLAGTLNVSRSDAASVCAWGGAVEGIDLVVNATPLGMSPQLEEMPILHPSVLASRPFVYDLIYNPGETVLLRTARAAGCDGSNGVRMLAEQGLLSLSLWTGRVTETLPLDLMLKAVEATQIPSTHDL